MICNQRSKIVKELDLLVATAFEEVDIQTGIKQDELDSKRETIKHLKQQLMFRQSIIESLLKR
jgi:hypothetical protein